MVASLILAGLLLPAVGALPNLNPRAAISNSQSSLTLLFQNNLNVTDDANHIGAILLDATAPGSAAAACEAIGEKLLSRAQVEAHKEDFAHQLAYQATAGRASPLQLYTIEGGILAAEVKDTSINFAAACNSEKPLPVLCTQSNNAYQPTNVTVAESSKISVAAAGNTYVGFRDQKSFRFLGIRYAEKPKRFEYTTLYKGTGETLQATNYGPQCMQPYSGGSEDCLFLNIQTPYLPKSASTKGLRPVHFWIHGGGFTGGASSDPGADGGQLASREDVVQVSMNYRLSTLGFLAVPGTNVKGNYGIADQQLALDWTVKNIASFGGDPNRITINGGSAGAGSVRVMLGSPQTIGKFKGAIALSNLGGGQNLGLDGNYATTYSKYLTIEEGFKRYGGLFGEAGCNQSTVQAQIECLKGIDGFAMVSQPTVARYVVQDGFYVNTPELILSGPNNNTAHVPVIFGTTLNDGASFTTYPKTPVSSELEGIKAALGISEYYAKTIIDSKLFPYYDTGNVTLDSFNVSQRVSNDNQFLCIDEATVYAGAVNGAFSAAYYYELTRTKGGYDPNNLGGPPVTPGYPNGNPNLPYFRLHGGDTSWMFGNLNPLREPADLYSTQISVGHMGEFIRSGQPNPSEEYLTVRGYTAFLDNAKKNGPWEKVKGLDGPIRLLDYPSVSSPFKEKEQCAFLGYPITFYK